MRNGADAPEIAATGWEDAALAPPRAFGRPPAAGRLRSVPEDFMVEEVLGFAPDGGAAHFLLKVEKTDANTLYVARSLARLAGSRPADVGFAGLKDRRAVAIQWFSVPAGGAAVDWVDQPQDGFRVLGAWPHSRKLRRGALAGNRFRIMVRGLTGDLGGLGERLGQAARSGVPNYFGPQRFGRAGSNLVQLRDWIDSGRLPRDHEQRGFVFSAARSLAFNQVLAARVNDGSWNRLREGEIVNLAGSGSVFAAGEIDAVLAGRCESFDVHPTGPMPGRGGVVPAAAAGRAEAEALAPLAPLVAALGQAGVDAARRPLRLLVGEPAWSVAGDALQLSFSLPRGAFATAVLREIVECDAAELPGGED